MPWTIVRPAPTTDQPPPLGTSLLPDDPSTQYNLSTPTLTPSPTPPTTIPGCPRGLELIALADELTIDRHSDDEYTVRTASGQPIFSASEETACCTCCGISVCRTGPAYRLVVEDLEKREVLSLFPPETSRFGAVTSCLQCLEEYEVSAAGGFPLGSVTEEPGCFSFHTRISVRSPDGDVKLQIVGPGCIAGCVCCTDVNLPVVTADGRQVGTVTNVWRGCMKEWCAQGKTYRVEFPPGLDPVTKVTLFGAVFVAGHTFFENNEGNA